MPIVAPQSPADCFDAAVEATRIAVTYRTPVMLLSDGYLANGSEPWRIPEVDDLPAIDPAFATEPNHEVSTDGREPRSSGPTCATRRPWPARGRSRARPVSSTASAAWRRATATATSPTTPPTTTSWCAPGRRRSTGSPSRSRRWRSTTRPVRRRVLVLGWGSTYGPIGAAVPARCALPASRSRRPICATSTRFPRDLGDLLKSYDAVMVPEMNLGQLSLLLRGEVPRRRRRLQPGARPAAAGCRAGRGDHRPDREHELGEPRASESNASVETPRAKEHSSEHRSRDARHWPASRRRTSPQNRKEYTSDQEVRWCPGCGDYAVLAAVQGFLPELGLRRENIVFVSGIGCS